GSSQVNLQVNPDGTLAVARAGTVLGTTSAAISINTWYHVEIKTTVHPSAGTAQVWLNGVSRLSLTGLNTRSTGNATANQFAIGPVLNNQNVGTTFDYDDVIVYDGQTTDAFGNPAMTGPVGDRGLSVRALTADGNYTQFTPNSGT